MIGVVVELVLTFLQFLSSLASIPDIELPDEWENPLYYVQVVNLDLPIVRNIFPSLQDFRVYFTVVCVIIPLSLIFFGLFFLNSAGVLLWYVVILSGFCLAIAGLLAMNLKDTLQLDVTDETAQSMMIVGVGLIAVALIVAAGYAVWAHLQRQRRAEEAAANAVIAAEQAEAGIESTNQLPVEAVDEDHETLQERMTRETQELNIAQTIVRVLTFIFFVGCAAVFFGLFIDFSLGDGMDGLQFGLAITMCVLALFTLAWTIMGCFLTGRIKQWKFFSFMEKKFMFLLLLTMSFLYIPVGAGLFVLFNCNDQTCPQGQQFMREGSWLPHNNTRQNGKLDVCIPCNAPAPQTCAQTQTQICGPETRPRLEIDKFIDCDDLVIFNIAAYLIIIMYMIGVPVMFGVLVNRTTTLVLDDFPIKMPKNTAEDDVAAIWELKVKESGNSARFLYHPFIPTMRYTRLYQLMQKLLVVFTAVFVIRVSGLSVEPVWYALFAGLIIHTLSFCWLVFRRPFLHKFENGIAMLMEFAMMGSMGCAIALYSGIDVPRTALITIIILNGVLPLMAIIIAIVLEWSSKKTREEEEKAEQEAALEEEMQRRLEEDERAEAEEAAQSASANPAPGGVEPAVGMPVYSNGEPQGSPPMDDSQLMGSAAVASLSKKPLSHKERVALQQERAKAAREAVEERKEKEKMELVEAQTNVDFRIDKAVKALLNRFLMIGGVFAFVALGLCIVGHLSERTTSPSRWDRAATEPNTETELAGYASWDEFTNNCCCRSNWADPSRTDAILVEQWRCANGNLHERVRIAAVAHPWTPTTKIWMDGRSIRGECSPNFELGCILLTGGVIGASDPAGVDKVSAYCSNFVNASGYAARWLW